MVKKAFIMVGLPGSGKSHWLRINLPDAEVYSADDFFTTPAGAYIFDPSKLPEAHGACLRNFINACQDEVEVVFCDNTSLSVAEIAPYYAVAQAYGYDVEIIHVKCDPQVAFKRNTHGVPEAAYPGMVARWEENKKLLPPWWKLTEV